MSACTAPIDSAVLAGYWLRELSTSEESTLEEHLLGCDHCCDELRQIVELSDAIRMLARQGSLRLVVSQSFLDKVAGEGLRVCEYNVPAGGSVACTITAQDDLLIGRLASDLSDARRVDLLFCDSAGHEQGRLRDIPFRAESTQVLLHESAVSVQLLPATVLIMKLVAVDDRQERVLGEYTFNHTPS